jgi:hypothetical protein
MPTDQKPNTTMPGVVEKIIKPLIPDEPEKVQIAVEGADHLYREIRIENTMTTADGETVGLNEKLTAEGRKARAGKKWYEKQVARVLSRATIAS